MYKNTSKFGIERHFIDLFLYLEKQNEGLYKKYQFLNNPKYWYSFSFEFTPYLKQIKNNKYKRLNYINRQGHWVLSALLQEISDLLVWNCDDGLLDMRVNKSLIRLQLEVSKLLILTTLKKEKTLIKMINTLQKMKFLKLLKTSKKGYIDIKLNLIQIDQSIRLVEMNIHDQLFGNDLNKKCIDNYWLFINIAREVESTSNLKTSLI
jgi:hypothetical protein